ncbi:STAS domain-containing protein [Streptomyces sp. NPDC056785]|uniref:STAS domain-containing protein n=1 Tax=Streptomyces sp. NPDC056785 TaxID=3345944 RepID=UPI00368217CD
MIFTVTDAGATAVFTPHGEIDSDSLPDLLSAVHMLPESVTGVTWDLREARFMDVAGLHLLVHQRSACQEAGRILTVVGLGRQPQRAAGTRVGAVSRGQVGRLPAWRTARGCRLSPGVLPQRCSLMRRTYASAGREVGPTGERGPTSGGATACIGAGPLRPAEDGERR